MANDRARGPNGRLDSAAMGLEMLLDRRFLLVSGVLSFGAFLSTGLYLHFVHDHLAGFELADRLFFRSRHIYILAASMTQLALGTYFVVAEQRVARQVQSVGTLLLVLSTPLLIAAFCLEHQTVSLRSPWSAFGLYALVAGVGCHLIVGSKL